MRQNFTPSGIWENKIVPAFNTCGDRAIFYFFRGSGPLRDFFEPLALLLSPVSSEWLVCLCYLEIPIYSS